MAIAPLTAEELLPLATRLSAKERVRLFRLLAVSASDAAAYQAAPPNPDEFATEDNQSDDPLAWDADGWENVG